MNTSKREFTTPELAKFIANDLRAHPERWTQGTFARNKDGTPVHPNEAGAVCWCLEGHVHRLCFNPDGYSSSLGNRSALARLRVGFEDLFSCSLVAFNDSGATTVEDVIGACELVAQWAKHERT